MSFCNLRHGWALLLQPFVLATLCCVFVVAEEKGAAKVDEIRHEPITVRGVTYDADGKPIEGAIVYFASTSYQQTLIAKTVTDEAGKY